MPGQVTAVAALGFLAGAIIEGGSLGWSSPFVIAGFAMSAIFAVLFVWRESRAPQPMLPLRLFKNRMFALTSLIGLLVNVAIYGLIFLLSLYFQQINGLSAFETGLAFVPMMGAVLLCGVGIANAQDYGPYEGPRYYDNGYRPAALPEERVVVEGDLQRLRYAGHRLQRAADGHRLVLQRHVVRRGALLRHDHPAGTLQCAADQSRQRFRRVRRLLFTRLLQPHLHHLGGQPPTSRGPLAGLANE